jgi:type VI secretion system protein ImpE
MTDYFSPSSMAGSARMLAQQLIRDGHLKRGLAALQDAVRKDAADVKLRVFLFQLLAVLGQWGRSLTQFQCEALRADIFTGKRAPLVFGEPQPWLAQLVEALKYDGTEPERAAALRAQAFEAAPASPGSIDDTPFAWLADADTRLGPVLEAIVNGRYFWIPFCRISRIEFDAPSDLRDAVWTAATFTWTNGAQTVGLIPTRYNGTLASGEDALLLARRTEWNEHGHGLGQRMLASDSAEYALMDVRVIAFDDQPDATAAAGQSNG